MTPTPHRMRLALTLAVVLVSFLAEMRPAAPAEAQSASGDPANGSIGVQVWNCPYAYRYDDYLRDCDPVGSGVDVVLNDVGAVDDSTALTDTTGDDARAGFIQLTAGGYVMHVDGLYASSGSYYACFDVSGGGERYLFDGSGDITIDLPASGDVFCRFYFWQGAGEPASNPTPVPEPNGDTANLRLQLFGCPDTFTETDYADVCRPGDHVSILPYIVSDQDVAYGENTDREGIADFTELPPGTYQFGASDTPRRPGQSVYYACFDTTDGDEAYLFDGDDPPGTSAIPTEGGHSYLCRYYTTRDDSLSATVSPAAGSDPATVKVQVAVCPDQYAGTAYRTDCADAGASKTVTLNPGETLDRDTATTSQTGTDGSARFADLAGGTYHVELSLKDEPRYTTTYSICFDTTAGGEAYVSDQNTGILNVAAPTGGSLLCRMYLIPNGTGDGSVTLTILTCSGENYPGPAWTDTCTTPLNSNTASLINADASGATSTRGPRPLVGEHPDANGSVTFDGLAPGSYGLTTDVPGHGTNFHGACVAGDGPVPDTSVTDDSRTGFTVTGDEHFTCVLYLSNESFRA